MVNYKKTTKIRKIIYKKGKYLYRKYIPIIKIRQKLNSKMLKILLRKSNKICNNK